MFGPFFPAQTTTLAAAAPAAAGYLAWIVITGVVALVAMIRIIRRPAADWPHGLWSKVGWILVVSYVTVPVGGYLIPLGAVVAIWRTRPHKPPDRPSCPPRPGRANEPARRTVVVVLGQPDTTLVTSLRTVGLAPIAQEGKVVIWGSPPACCAAPATFALPAVPAPPTTCC